MAYAIRRSEREIDDVLNKCFEIEDEAENRTNRPDLTYEQGVSSALRWVIGWTNFGPLDPL